MQIKYLIIAIASVVLISSAGLWLYPDYNEFKKTEKQYNDLKLKLMSAKAENEDLDSHCHALETDNREIERVARDVFGMCREGEKIYDFIEP